MGWFDKKPETEARGATGQAGQYLYSFSGADADVLCWFPHFPQLIKQLGSVHTISVSVHESKGQARALGHRGIKGLARGVRTIAGSLILTVINDHPLSALYSQYNEGYVATGTEPDLGWSVDRHRTGVGSLFNNYDYNNRLAVLLPPFNLAVQYVSEQGKPWSTSKGERPEGAGWMLEGVEFLDEGQVTSVNDIVTEMTFSFLACDFKPFSYYDVDASSEAQAYIQEEDTRMKQLHAALQDSQNLPHLPPGIAPGIAGASGRQGSF